VHPQAGPGTFPLLGKALVKIYRVLGVSHPHLEELLPILEKCLANNFEPTGLFKPSASEFYSTLSTVLAARWFLGRGYSASSCDTARGQERVLTLLLAIPTITS